MTPLALRKRLLLAESELNRAQLAQEWETVAQSVGSVARQAKKISSIALTAGLLVAGLRCFWPSKPPPAVRKAPWWQTLWKGAKLGASLWSQFNPPPKS
jgi:hypothetical protein